MIKDIIKLSSIAKQFKCKLIGEDIVIDGLNLCNRSTENKSVLSYIASLQYVKSSIENANVKAVLISLETYNEIKEKDVSSKSFLICDFPEQIFYDIHKNLVLENQYDNFNFAKQIGDNCEIHPTAIIEDGVIIYSNVKVGPYSVIKQGSIIGANTSIGIGTIIGSAGFQALKDVEGKPYNVPHVGGVKIGNNVWIGDHVTICNALFEGYVTIGNYCLIDNHCHIAHNCFVDDRNSLASSVILFGSVHIKENCWISPGSMVMNKIEIGTGTFISPNSFVVSNTLPDSKYIGSPAVKIDEHIKREKSILKMTLNSKKK